VNIVSKSANHGSNVMFLGILSNPVVTGKCGRRVVGHSNTSLQYESDEVKETDTIYGGSYGGIEQSDDLQ